MKFYVIIVVMRATKPMSALQIITSISISISISISSTSGNYLRRRLAGRRAVCVSAVSRGEGIALSLDCF